MLNKLDLDKIMSEINEKSYIYEGDNNVTILKTDKNMYSVLIDERDSIKLLFEINNFKYEVIPFEFQKYKNIFEKYAKKKDLYFFQWYFYENPTENRLFDFKTNKISNKFWLGDDIIKAAKMFKYNVHVNEKPKEWNQYSNEFLYN